MRYQEERFLALKEEFLALAERLGLEDVQCIPISALAGDNVVERSARMLWYEGPTLLEHLETAPITKPANTRGVRFPVQYVIRPDANFRGFAGQVAGGVIRPGDTVTALPSGQRSRVESIVTYDGPLAGAFSSMSVTLKLEDEIDLSRGDMLVAPDSPPHVSQRFAATMVWMHAQPLEAGRTYLIKQSARQVPGKVTKIRHRVNINTLEPEAAERLDMNDIAAVEVETNRPLFFDSYDQNRTTGSFIVIDPLTNATLGAGMIRENLLESSEKWTRHGTPRTESPIISIERHRRHGHYPAVILVDAGTELARRIERALFEEGFEVMVVGEDTGSRASAKTAWSTLHAAGFVVIYQNPSLTSEERLELKTAVGDRLFDLADLKSPSSDVEALEHILTFAKTLRFRAEDETRILERWFENGYSIRC